MKGFSMYKKSLIFAIAVICSNMQASPLGGKEDIPYKFEEYKPSINPAHKVILQTCQKRLDVLEQEEKTQYDHTNRCWFGVAAGIAIIALACMNIDKSQSIGTAGFVIAAGAGGLGLTSLVNENSKARTRIIERNDLLNKINGLSQNK